MAKSQPGRVDADLARQALARTQAAGDRRGALYTHYIVAHFEATRQLAPGCDFRDLVAWYSLNAADELAALTAPLNTRRAPGKRAYRLEEST